GDRGCGTAGEPESEHKLNGNKRCSSVLTLNCPAKDEVDFRTPEETKTNTSHSELESVKHKNPADSERPKAS
ncbi:hypothetical protein P7K49_008840, partial [Saguinus oedipus]